ncbi:PAS-domain containing protein [Rhodoblastus acidophilus]|uniref:histidine kinase n=1 Tax=Candidatus Rhodoblastus alkanivorans TaxID=2954117 RepID=A0ABS9Z2U4_9HYPH|nr:PAS domain-containing sensor histidine kinase [Candidatus Rhodoblastus alkanivorans]MCI4679741.1 PAS-domain containing protein [Candidatus Rhodoblastus alkanivorans]MCI4681979.1 PAS-domain containing protein [Candidatus Rhodoblastus alkanivorans]MDI4643030.1 PAS-domain containing protein [Rhodoblastus acidophilus]
MPQRGRKTDSRRAARLRLASGLASAPLLLLAGASARGQAIAGFAGADAAIGLSLGAGLVVFATITALLHLAGRQRWSRRETELTAEIEQLRQKVERARAFLASETQFVVVWGGAHGEPEIEGDVSLVLDAPVPRRVLGFGAWLPPDQAQALEANVALLRERGQGFRQDLVSQSGRHLEAEGRAIGSRVVMRVRDVSGDRLELMRLRKVQAEQNAQLEVLRGLLDLSNHPVWTRGPDQALDWVNAAYARAVDAKNPQDAVARGLELLDRPAREAAARARQAGNVWRRREHVVVEGVRRLVDVLDAPLPGGGGGVADDLAELEALRADHARQVESHIRTLDQIATAVAIFDRSKKLVFANAAYRHLWGLDQAFLEQGPSDSEILDRLRAARRLPEQADYRGWKTALHSVYQTLEPAPQVWHLPDGRTLRVAFDPNPQGGVTYLFDDVTERFALESQYNSLARVQSETLDALQEGVAVFGADGRLKFCNPAFIRLWRLPANVVAERPHIDTITAACSPLLADDGVWSELRTAVAGLHSVRMGFERRMSRSDGAVVDCAVAPLPDGGTLLTFIDVTDGVNVERALKERNQALLAAEQLRNDFVHHFSYELRSPLTNIIGFIQLLGDNSVGPLNEKQREYAGYVMKSSAALLAIINDILDLATIDRDAMELQLGDVDIQRAMREAVEGLQDRLAESHVELSIVAAPDIGSFRADGQRIRQVLFNLLSNAIGFSEPGQVVTLAALRRDGEIVFKVTDRGRGIPPELLDKVFGRFESHTVNSRHRGVGLGLSIVRAFVELHGGQVHIDSAPGEGTVVTCIFPTRGGQIECRPNDEAKAEGRA